MDRYGYKRDFKIYEADPIQEADELEEASKTPKGYQRRIMYNPTWENVKAHAKEYLESEDGKRIYSYRKIDVEPIFGHLKNVFEFTSAECRISLYDDESSEILEQRAAKALFLSCIGNLPDKQKR